MVTVDLTKNDKQTHFFNTVLEAAIGENPFRYLFYGGAIRGGKTYACITILVVLCKMFPGSKWYVIRKSFSSIKETTLPTIQKILGSSPRVRWNRDPSNYYIEFLDSRSRIYLAGEDLKTDQDLKWLLGLECNGFFLEQIEELSEKLFDMCISRAGSWYIEKMPSPLILGSFNPTLTWVRKKIYQPWEDGQLVAPYYYEDAKPTDNPYVTSEQWAAWKNMDPELQKQFIAGSWDFAKPSNAFAYNFMEKRHEDFFKRHPFGYQSDYPLYLSFDFNVEPITCLAAQHEGFEWCHILKEFRRLNSDIDELCEDIITAYPAAHYIVTGDASGQHRTALKKNLNYYKSIMHNLQISTLQKKVPRANPSIRNTRVLCNSLLANHPSYWINTHACPHLVLDLNAVVVGDDGDIDKAKDKRKTHLLDCWRYYNWTFHRDFLDSSIYRYAGND